MIKHKMVKNKTGKVWTCNVTYKCNDLKHIIKEKRKHIKSLNSSRRALQKIIALQQKLSCAKCAYNQSLIDDMNENINEINNKINKIEKL